MKHSKLVSTLRFALAVILLGGISAGVSLRANDGGCGGGGCGGGGCSKGSTNGPSGSTNAPTKGN